MTQDYEQLRLQLAENIRSMRRVKNLTQEQLALMAEVDRTYVSQIERGGRQPVVIGPLQTRQHFRDQNGSAAH